MAGKDVEKEAKSVKEAQDAATSAAADLKKALALLGKANESAKGTKKELSGEDDSE